jgi:hypothetical protein
MLAAGHHPCCHLAYCRSVPGIATNRLTSQNSIGAGRRKMMTPSSRRLLALCLVAFSMSVQAAIEVRTAAGDYSPEPQFRFQETFSCSDSVFVVVDIVEYPAGLHRLGIRWEDPSGTQREYSEYEFRLIGDRERVWGWIKLHRASGAGVLRWLDSSAGMEEFIGQWRVKVEIDGQPVGESGFQVLC